MNGHFVYPMDDLQLQWLPEESNGRRMYKLLHDWAYSTSKGKIIIAVTGFKTDFGSIPRIFWRVFPPDGDYAPATVIHDWMCIHPEEYPRLETDDTFLEAMKVLKISYISRYTIYWAVRAYSWWNKK